jgi:hypothetical protein
MRDQAQQLDQQEREIAQDIGEQIDARQKTLAGPDANRDLADRIGRQKENLEKLTDQMKNVSEQAEASEPLLSRSLYDTLREADTGNLDKALDTTGELLKRDLLPQAREIERRAGEGIGEIRKGVEEAARNVLGDEADSLRLARQRIEELLRQVNQEMANAPGAGSRQASDANESTTPAERQQAGAQSGTGNDRQSEQPRDQAQDRPGSDTPQRAQQSGSPRDGTQSQSPERGGARADAGGPDDPRGLGGSRASSGQWDDTGTPYPFTGEDFRQWSDGLRDVEEMLTEQEMRDEAARIRDRARAIRAEFKRHGKEPQWDLVRSQVAEPLTGLQKQVEKKLAQLQSDEKMAPIDRDPVPDRFADLVRAYFENLGQEGK